MRLQEKMLTYKDGNTTLVGYLVSNDKISGKRPGILVVPEWWGLVDYTKMRARELAELGYVALAVDAYGDGKVASDPKEAMALATPFYQDPQLAKSRVEAALEALKKQPEVDPDKLAAIGYCFGGFVVLNAAKLGVPLKGVVSFHGGMGGAPVDKNLLTAKILICQGGADKAVPVPVTDAFVHQLDSIGAAYTYKIYPGATHAFTNPASTSNGIKFHMPIAYNAKADTASWNDMKAFLGSIFGEGH